MSTLSQFFSSGGFPVLQEVMTTSKTITIPFTGTLYIFACAGGGSGGSVNIMASATIDGKASGGGAGEAMFDRLKVIAGQTFTFTLGAGAGSQIASLNTAAAGIAGGTTTITSSAGYSCTLGGGGAGQASRNVGGTTNLAGGVGGTGGSGGSPVIRRIPGGRGGNVQNSAANSVAVSGGGGIPIFASTSNGGDITGSSSYIYSGGGGVGGNAQDITSVGGRGGGSRTSGAVQINGIEYATDLSLSNILIPYNFYQSSNNIITSNSTVRLYAPGAGVGGTGGSGGVQTDSQFGENGGAFGGGGGYLFTVSSATSPTGNIYAGDGGFGSGGGGVLARNGVTSPNKPAVSGKGGKGFASVILIG